MPASTTPLRYEVRVRFGHKAWNNKLVNLNKYTYASKDEAITQVVDLAKGFFVSTEAFIIHDSVINVDYLFTNAKEYVALDRLQPTNRSGGNNETQSPGNQEDHS